MFVIDYITVQKCARFVEIGAHIYRITKPVCNTFPHINGLLYLILLSDEKIRALKLRWVTILAALRILSEDVF